MLGLGRRLPRLRWRRASCRNLCLVEVGAAQCPGSRSSHGRVEDPSLEVAAAGTEMVEVLKEARSLRWKVGEVEVLVVVQTQTDEAARRAARTHSLMTHTQAVVPMVLGTSP
jgi:hypothetical protein